MLDFILDRILPVLAFAIVIGGFGAVVADSVINHDGAAPCVLVSGC